MIDQAAPHTLSQDYFCTVISIMAEGSLISPFFLSCQLFTDLLVKQLSDSHQEVLSISHHAVVRQLYNVHSYFSKHVFP